MTDSWKAPDTSAGRNVVYQCRAALEQLEREVGGSAVADVLARFPRAGMASYRDPETGKRHTPWESNAMALDYIRQVLRHHQRTA